MTFNFEEGSFLNYMLAPADREDKAEAEQGLVTDVTGTCTATAGAVMVALDSGATTSCFKEGSDFRTLSQPITVRGALPGLTSLARGTMELPCPALPSGTLRGLHSPNFRHNLVSLGDLQKKGVEVLFPAGTSDAMCLDPKTGKVLWRFKRSPQGLYEARVLSSEDYSPKLTGAELHPSVVLHRRLGHMGEASITQLCKYQAIEGLPAHYKKPPYPLSSDCLPCIQSKTQAKPHPSLGTRATGLLDKVHLDLVGPLPTGLFGQRYWLNAIDDSSRYGVTIPLRSKDEAKEHFLA